MFDQELELFELPDLDADGEDAGIDVDDIAEDILIGQSLKVQNTKYNSPTYVYMALYMSKMVKL